jgi:hypothetical protein
MSSMLLPDRVVSEIRQEELSDYIYELVKTDT